MRTLILSLCLAKLLFVQETSKLEISKNEYKQRRTALMEKVKEGMIIVGCEKLRGAIPCGDDDQTSYFDFVYLTGLQESGAVLVMTPTDGKVALFSADPKAAKEKTGLETLHSCIDKVIWGHAPPSKEEVVITNRHKPVVRLTAVKQAKRKLGFLGEGVWMSPDFNAPLKDFRDYQ